MATFLVFIMLIAAIVGAIQSPPKTCSTNEESNINVTTSKDMTKNAKSIYSFMRSKGATPQAASGILGVWQFESGLSTTAHNPSGATGLAQWLGGRFTALQSYASSHGGKTSDLNMQLGYFWKEANSGYYKGAGVIKDLKITDVHKATYRFLMDYEGMSQNPEQWYLTNNGSGGPGRYQMADAWYGKLGADDKVSGSIIADTSDDFSSNSGCSSDDTDSIGGTWGWPFKGHGSFGSEQDFGASASRQGNFHDGLDFGTASWPGSNVMAVHAGKVIFAGDPGTVGIDNSFPNGLGKSVVVTKDGNMEIVYQEFNTSTGGIKVHKGDTVKTGQVIGTRNTDHLHLGITKKMGWQQAEGHAFKNDGTWLDPQKLITEGMKKNK
ncbi:phage tail tip lysozyme [Pediococcus inopinatus]|uniref:Phage tail tip lysozyme n=1 Tax=Pediococcus inopinatus TaxID=114090 RepID=A0ABZ0Q379_9LACO|nr:phage tail tip lysozyme [Pediococcus inopinatus]WPC19273.1 phage tail tip lysozyme [Pediococcus inopinatus]WPC21063.1 phage tail tip lysozyme [Pediococcus inopinatus]